MALEALLFDVDGTLADTEKTGHRVAFNLAFEQAGLDWHWDETMYGQLLAVTGGKERMHHYLEHFYQGDVATSDREGLIQTLHQAKTHHYTQLLQTGAIPLRTGVERLLRQAHQAQMRMAIVTTTTPANVTALLQHTLGPESIDWFEVIAAGDVVPAKKPAPDIYQWALAKMDLAPDQTLAFEDSDNGLLSASAAGVPTLVTPNDYTQTQDFSSALMTLSHLGAPEAPAHVMSVAPVLERETPLLSSESPWVNLAQLHHWHQACQH